MSLRKVLFFTAGMEATATELLQIAHIRGNVQIRNGAALATYGGNLEPAHALAGTVPAAYKTASGNTIIDTALYPDGDVTPLDTVGIAGLKIVPVNPGGIDAVAGTKQLYAIKGVIDPDTDALVMTDVTTSCAWTSATTGKATVGAGTGLVTAANGGAGTSVITASYDWDGAGSAAPLTATTTVTCV